MYRYEIMTLVASVGCGRMISVPSRGIFAWCVLGSDERGLNGKEAFLWSRGHLLASCFKHHAMLIHPHQSHVLYPRATLHHPTQLPSQARILGHPQPQC